MALGPDVTPPFGDEFARLARHGRVLVLLELVDAHANLGRPQNVFRGDDAAAQVVQKGEHGRGGVAAGGGFGESAALELDFFGGQGHDGGGESNVSVCDARRAIGDVRGCVLLRSWLFAYDRKEWKGKPYAVLEREHELTRAPLSVENAA